MIQTLIGAERLCIALTCIDFIAWSKHGKCTMQQLLGIVFGETQLMSVGNVREHKAVSSLLVGAALLLCGATIVL